MLWLLPKWIDKESKSTGEAFVLEKNLHKSLITTNINARLVLRYKSSGSNCAKHSAIIILFTTCNKTVYINNFKKIEMGCEK